MLFRVARQRSRLLDMPLTIMPMPSRSTSAWRCAARASAASTRARSPHPATTRAAISVVGSSGLRGPSRCTEAVVELVPQGQRGLDHCGRRGSAVAPTQLRLTRRLQTLVQRPPILFGPPDRLARCERCLALARQRLAPRAFRPRALRCRRRQLSRFLALSRCLVPSRARADDAPAAVDRGHPAARVLTADHRLAAVVEDHLRGVNEEGCACFEREGLAVCAFGVGERVEGRRALRHHVAQQGVCATLHGCRLCDQRCPSRRHGATAHAAAEPPLLVPVPRCGGRGRLWPPDPSEPAAALLLQLLPPLAPRHGRVEQRADPLLPVELPARAGLRGLPSRLLDPLLPARRRPWPAGALAARPTGAPRRAGPAGAPRHGSDAAFAAQGPAL